MTWEVERRAAGRCEYCRMHQSPQGATFHIEHIQPLCLGGTSQLENLTLACPSCNLHKSNRVSVQEPNGETTSLFHRVWQFWLAINGVLA